jgi:hypothetical protein
MPSLPRLIGVNGYARSGKDTAAGFLVERYGYTQAAWADVLRECARAVNPIIGFDWLGPVRWHQVFDEFGYEGAKDHPEYGAEFRRVMLTIGTEMGRNILGENTWVNAALDRLDPKRRYVFSDTRFPNEAEAVTTSGGIVVRINRPGIGPVTDHPSETALDDWNFDLVVENDGTLNDFYYNLELALANFSGVRLPS